MSSESLLGKKVLVRGGERGAFYEGRVVKENEDSFTLEMDPPFRDRWFFKKDKTEIVAIY